MDQVDTKSALERRAADMAGALMDEIGGNCGWRPRMWKKVMTAVELVGDDAREANPYAVLLYQRFILIAQLYLIQFPNFLQRRRLVRRICSDLASLECYRSQMDVRAFDAHELVLVENGAKEIRNALEIIDR